MPSSVVEQPVDLPNKQSPVSVSLESKGVSFIAFQLKLLLGNTLIRVIHEDGTESDLGRAFPLEDAVTLRGLTLVCKGVVGAAVATTIQLHCRFACDGQVFSSAVATAQITPSNTSVIFPHPHPLPVNTWALLSVAAMLLSSVAPSRAQSHASVLQKLERRLATLEAENSRLAAEVATLKRASAPQTVTGSAGAAAPGGPTAPPPTGRLSAAALLAREGAALDLDRPIAAVPAFTALDLSPESVSQPANPRDFTAALLNGVDRKGILQTGVAIEVAPFRWIPGRWQSYPHYSGENKDVAWGGYWNRFFYNASLSVATAKASGDEDEQAINLALGLQFVLWQDAKNDPLRDKGLQQAFHKAFSKEVISDIPDDGPIDAAAPPASLAAAQAQFQAEVEAFRQREWMGTLWTASIAPTWHSASGRSDDLRAEGFTAWSTFAYAFEEPVFGRTARAQVLAHLRYRQGEIVTDSEEPARGAEQDSLLAAARLRIGTPDFNGFVEGGYQRIWGGLSGDGDAARAAFGLERRIARGVWLVVSAGEQFGGTSDRDGELFAISSLRFGTADQPTLAPAPAP
jgi:hypothetical protein